MTRSARADVEPEPAPVQLLVLLGSICEPLMATQPWLVSVPGLFAVVTNVSKAVCAPTANGPSRVQVNVGAAKLQSQPLSENDGAPV